ncbi:uncharacterized protein B0H18DRAFT_995345 [Fomitopsis serialis]|uniref:uncharacterized protein n=1 Tax=Fomitopsis serialis TaxID=139415 RepID=UPI0020087FE8|nr:uncharacterized protein B0H18DRAFT_995345 [Neoantrodia serialis]KAH9930133.1 hypothetical protein B0H18DRAFT_995345 [Neoantrodia serialis]
MQGTPSKKKSILGQISLFDRTLPEFFQRYVPCESPFPGTLAGMRKLVRDFQPRRKPKFADGSRCPILFPFKAWEDEHNYTMPDILCRFPDNGARLKLGGAWKDISMVFEIKPTSGEDPIGKYGVKPSKRETGTLTQLAKSARNLLLTHGMLFVFVVGIYGDIARIYRVDHAACVVSRSFDIKETPWPLHELLWRFCHYQAPERGVAGAPLTFMLLGADPSVQRATEGDVKLAEEMCAKVGIESLTETDKQACRWITIPRYSEDGTEAGATRYLIYRIRSLNPRLFSRATIVWDALEEGTWEPCAIKDAWRQLARDREDVLYDEIRGAFQSRSWRELFEDYVFMHRNDGPEEKPSIPTGPFQVDDQGCPMLPPEIEEMLVDAQLDPTVAELYGLPETSYSDDLGAREANQSLRPDSGDIAGARDGLNPVANSTDQPPMYGHRTICGQLRDPQKAEYDERSHMRLIMKTTTRELIRAFRDAIIGHRQAYLAGVIHRDVSEGNVMLCDTWIIFFAGFLLDFDYSFDWKAALRHAGMPVNEANWKMFVKQYNESLAQPGRPGPPEQKIPVLGPHNTNASPHAQAAREQWEARMKMKERTGTLYFMAIEILETFRAHDVRHDLESFFWLLLWIVLRYTDNTDCYTAYLTLFDAQTGRKSAAGKRQFLTTPTEFEVKDNEPLTTLIHDFKTYARQPTVPLTYESVLAVFDKALANPSWPKNDAALPGQDGSAGSRQDKKRSRSDVDDMERIEEQHVDNDDPFGMHEPAAKRPQIACPGLSPLRFELGEAGPSH